MKVPRPIDKMTLQQLSKHNYQKLLALIDALTPEQQLAAFPFEDRDKIIRDALIHLYRWHQLLINWLKNNLERFFEKCEAVFGQKTQVKQWIRAPI